MPHDHPCVLRRQRLSTSAYAAAAIDEADLGVLGTLEPSGGHFCGNGP
jgi:hypothetical protein